MPLARERSRMDAPSYPFSQKMRLACSSTIAIRRSKSFSGRSDLALRPFKGKLGSRVSGVARAIRRADRTFVRVFIMPRSCLGGQMGMQQLAVSNWQLDKTALFSRRLGPSVGTFILDALEEIMQEQRCLSRRLANCYLLIAIGC